MTKPLINRTVILRVKAEDLEEFHRAIASNAQHTAAERGCRQFDVVENTSDPTEFVLYEVYDDEVALALHEGTTHFHRWQEAEAEVTVVTETVVRDGVRRIHHVDP